MRQLVFQSPRGFTLIEVLIVIMVVGVAGATLMSLSLRGTELSAQNLELQQAELLAAALLNEVKAKPFTYCDPSDDAATATATSPAGCSVPDVAGQEGGETRSNIKPLDHVTDYDQLVLTGANLTDAGYAALLPSVAACTARFRVQAIALGGGITAGSGNAVRIIVNVLCRGMAGPIQVDGVKVRYAPNRYTY